MRCKDCERGQLLAYDTKTAAGAEDVRRYRKCNVCGKTVTTQERVISCRRVRVVRIG